MYELEGKQFFNTRRCRKIYKICLVLHFLLAILQLFTPRPFLFITHIIVLCIGINFGCAYLTFKYFCFTIVNMICGISNLIWLLFKCIGKNRFKWLDPQYYWKIINNDNIFLEFFSTSLHYMFDSKKIEDTPENIQMKYEYIKNFFKLLPVQKKTYLWKIYIELFIIIIGIFLYFFGSYISWKLYKYSLNYNQNYLLCQNYPYGTFNDDNSTSAPTNQSEFIPFNGQPYRISDFLDNR
ncbi:conserved protein, unknown function [Hepatocystis sp. ex Piliocolobus tephrosceles]|nr:conserved protein, unknown function [Hepatocystis sp. ex Piliocolobus tephrosceles]